MVLASLDSDAFKMQTESQISTESEALLHPGNAPVQNEDGGLGPSTPPNNIVLQQPVKKTTRQWAAWTRQEEESFFTALRQVGKNFEKITHRVQSKNKDQVRHYYYRLVRRMNKLLGPGLSLDAKNSKDTNAAMLRWWSLLEKYSCKASKLHLKPRRFKIFIEALEHQLLKDRKRNVKKRSCQGENSSPTSPDCVSNQSRASGQDTCTVKLVFVDSQNIQKLGPAKGSLKRNVSMGVNRNSNKGESTSMKPARQRRKPGVVSSAAFKKWEKAAIAGVSLVADAAEHLERSTTDKEMKLDQVQKDIHSAGRALPPLPSAAQDPITESNINIPVKLKLQLFPIDDGTRRALEMDNHNPHLELTLSSRKRISSVLEHLNRKWGSSAIASGELTLFPYVVQRENLVGHQRWTRVSTVSAADVYAMIGSPPLFRLRYGWFSNAELDSVALQAPSVSSCTPCVHSVNVESRKDPITTESPTSVPLTSNQSEKHMDPSNLQLPSVDENAGDMRLSNSPMLSTNEWADSLTNISIGDLLLDAPQDMDGPVAESSQCLNEIPFSCDSFDAAIAAHISRHQNKMVTASTFGSHASSIWDAEETCDAFSFQKNATLSQGVSRFPDIASPATCKPAGMNSELPDAKEPIDYTAYGNPMDECPTDPQALDHSVKDFSGLTDISWPDSLGPLDLDIPSSKYRGDDLFLGDSLGGLSRLIASSLDAFQNCSFFGLDKKESTPTAEARENAPLSDFKIGSRG